jgi:hypothetical protein
MGTHYVPEKMRTFNHRSVKGGVYLITDFGIVTSDIPWSDTTVSSSGGGGFINQGTGYVNAPTVRTEVFHCRKITYKRPDGTIRTAEIPANQFGFAQGHEIALLFFDEWPLPFAVKNCSTGEWCGFGNQSGHLIALSFAIMYGAILRHKQKRSPFNLKSLFGSSSDNEGAALFRNHVIKVMDSI